MRMSENKQIKKFNIGLIGLGYIGKVHAHAYHILSHAYAQPQVLAEVKTILRSKTGGADEFLASLGSPLETTNQDEFFRQGLDLVDICTPNLLHLEQVKAAASHKLPIYCEKPLGLNLEHARQITQTAIKASVPTHTALVMRYFPNVRQAKSVLSSGELGEILNFRAHLFHNSYIDPERPISWRLRHAESGGGALADLGVHVMDLVRYLLGEAQWIQCRTRTFIDKRPVAGTEKQMAAVDVDDWGVCLLGLQNGAQGVIEATRMSGGLANSTKIEIFGSHGSLEIDLENPHQIKFYSQKSGQTISGPLHFPTPPDERPISQIWPSGKTSMGGFRDAHTACIYDFLLNMYENKPSMVDFQSALKSQEILEAAYKSAASNGQTINLPLK